MKEQLQEDPVITIARNIVVREIALRMEMAIKQSDYVKTHQSGCKCHHCIVQYEQIRREVEEEAYDWIAMLSGSPTQADKLKPDWTKKHPPKPVQVRRPHDPPASP